MNNLKYSNGSATYVESLEKKIAELKKQIVAIDMNNEPVAWMLADKEAKHIRSIMAVQHDFVPQGCVEIPLYTHPVSQYKAITNTKIEPTVVSYTHPVKELTDEEIIKVYEDMLGVASAKGSAIDFARAIEKRIKNGN